MLCLAVNTLGAAGLPVPQSDVAIASDGRAGTPQSDLLAAAHIADGSHLDALVPMQVNGNTGNAMLHAGDAIWKYCVRK